MRRIAAVGVLFGMLAVALALPGHAAAAGASPASVNFGGVPINTTASRDVTITVDAGYRTEVASGSGLNAPFAFDFTHLRHRRRLLRPGHLHRDRALHTQQASPPPAPPPTCSSARSSGAPASQSPTAFRAPGSASPRRARRAVNFGNVPINTTAHHDVTITVDAGYRTEVASGSGLNAPFAFDFNTCGTGGGFSGPGSCTVTERYTPTTTSASSGTTNVFECPIVGGSCIAIPFSVQGTGVSVAAANPAQRRLRWGARSTPPPPAPSRSPSTLATSSLSSPAAGSAPRSASPSGPAPTSEAPARAA